VISIDPGRPSGAGIPGRYRPSDSNAYRNLRSGSGWRGWAFIGAAKDDGGLAISAQTTFTSQNRWTALAPFIAWMLEQGAV